MGKVYAAIDDKIQRWMARQRMFFVATAPLSGDGRVKLSPKGHDTLRILDDQTLVLLRVRSIVRVDVQRVSDSCGFGLPLCNYKAQRDTSPDYIRKQGPDKIRDYRVQVNGQSIDGLPGMIEEESGAFEGPV